MNPPSGLSRLAALFRSNRNQAVRIPKDMEFPEGVKEVVVRRVGNQLILTPPDAIWDDFFDRPGIDIEEPDELPYDARERF